MAPVACRSAAVTGRPARETPTTIEFEPVAQIGSARCQSENGHDFRSRRNHKARLAVASLTARLVLLTGAHNHTPQGAVVHVLGARPRDLCRIEVERVAEEKVRIDHGGQQIVRGGDGVKVAVKVEIDLMARFHLRQASARRSAFEAKDRTQRWLARGDDRFAPDVLQALGQADGDHGLAFSGGRRCGGRDKDEFAARRKGGVVEQT